MCRAQYASVAVGENGQSKPAAAWRQVQRRGHTDKLKRRGA